MDAAKQKIVIHDGPFADAVFLWDLGPRCIESPKYAQGEVISFLDLTREVLVLKVRRDCPSKEIAIYIFESRDHYVDFYAFDHMEPTKSA